MEGGRATADVCDSIKKDTVETRKLSAEAERIAQVAARLRTVAEVDYIDNGGSKETFDRE
ncbi:MAG: hypothetical protein WA996_10660 [Candidatus Promineifilaceae bacterium]